MEERKKARLMNRNKSKKNQNQQSLSEKLLNPSNNMYAYPCFLFVRPKMSFSHFYRGGGKKGKQQQNTNNNNNKTSKKRINKYSNPVISKKMKKAVVEPLESRVIVTDEMKNKFIAILRGELTEVFIFLTS